jgi:ribosomal protein L16 Arg81 hydroxylase
MGAIAYAHIDPSYWQQQQELIQRGAQHIVESLNIKQLINKKSNNVVKTQTISSTSFTNINESIDLSKQPIELSDFND